MSEKSVKVEGGENCSSSSSITGSFSRADLRKKWGSSFPDKGKKKSGTIEHDIVVESQSPAVKDGRVILKSDGTVNRTCSAVRQGLLLFHEDGTIRTDSELVTQKQVTLHETNAAHIFSFEVFDVICKKRNLTITQADAEATILALNRYDNLQEKTRPGNMWGKDKAKKTGDHTLDLKIIDAIKNGTELSALVANRARKAIEIILASGEMIPRWIIEEVRAEITKLRDEDGYKICRSNAEIVEVKENESRRNHKKDDRKQTGLKDDGTPDGRTKKGQEMINRKETGLKNDGTPDGRTTKGQEKIARAETGLKDDGTPDLRTLKGRELQKESDSKLIVKNEFLNESTPNSVKKEDYSKYEVVQQQSSFGDRKVTGLKNDGLAYDMRTTKGKELYASASIMISNDNSSREVPQQTSFGDRKVTGLKNDGLGYDMRTTKGKELYASASTINTPSKSNYQTPSENYTTTSTSTSTSTSYSSPSKAISSYPSGVSTSNYYSSMWNYQTPSQSYTYYSSPSSYSQESSDRKLTGLKNDGVGFDMRTTKGRELQASTSISKGNTNSFASKTVYNSFGDRKMTGLKNDGTPDLRTTKGKELNATNSFVSPTVHKNDNSEKKVTGRNAKSSYYQEDTPSSYTDTPSSYTEDSSSSYNPSYTYETAYASGDISYGDYAFCSDYFRIIRDKSFLSFQHDTIYICFQLSFILIGQMLSNSSYVFTLYERND